TAEAEEFRTVFATYARSWSGTEDPALDTGDLTCWQAGELLSSASTGDTETLILRAPEPVLIEELMGLYAE
ncbi:MAG: hypothetical protein ACFB51_15860, partial [Anaerolineae bacterium]